MPPFVIILMGFAGGVLAMTIISFYKWVLRVIE